MRAAGSPRIRASVQRPGAEILCADAQVIVEPARFVLERSADRPCISYGVCHRGALLLPRYALRRVRRRSRSFVLREVVSARLEREMSVADEGRCILQVLSRPVGNGVELRPPGTFANARSSGVLASFADSGATPSFTCSCPARAGQLHASRASRQRSAQDGANRPALLRLTLLRGANCPVGIVRFSCCSRPPQFCRRCSCAVSTPSSWDRLQLLIC